MLWGLGYQDMKVTVADLGVTSKDTHLKLDLKGRHPELGLTDIAYEKGAHFLWLIERTVGRERFDVFLRKYFDGHAFQTITTTQFLQYLDDNLLKGHEDWKKAIDIQSWVYGPGIPANCPHPDRERFAKVDKVIADFEGGARAGTLDTKAWSTYEWLHFLRSLKAPVALNAMQDLDNTFHFTQTGNSEIADLWFVQAVKAGYEPAFPAMKQFLLVTGRQNIFLKHLPPAKCCARRTSRCSN